MEPRYPLPLRGVFFDKCLAPFFIVKEGKSRGTHTGQEVAVTMGNPEEPLGPTPEDYRNVNIFNQPLKWAEYLKVFSSKKEKCRYFSLGRCYALPARSPFLLWPSIQLDLLLRNYFVLPRIQVVQMGLNPA